MSKPNRYAAATGRPHDPQTFQGTANHDTASPLFGLLGDDLEADSRLWPVRATRRGPFRRVVAIAFSAIFTIFAICGFFGLRVAGALLAGQSGIRIRLGLEHGPFEAGPFQQLADPG